MLVVNRSTFISPIPRPKRRRRGSFIERNQRWESKASFWYMTDVEKTKLIESYIIRIEQPHPLHKDEWYCKTEYENGSNKGMAPMWLTKKDIMENFTIL